MQQRIHLIIPLISKLTYFVKSCPRFIDKPATVGYNTYNIKGELAVEFLKNTSVCFTGHRKILGVHTHVLPIRLDRAIQNLIRLDYCNFIAGGAVGFDMIAAEAVLAARERDPRITLFLALPCRDQTARWKNPSDIARYQRLVEKANAVHYIQDSYSSTCMHKRNRWMIDNSAVCVAYLNASASGGTAYTVNYARGKDVPVVNLADSSFMEIFAE